MISVIKGLHNKRKAHLPQSPEYTDKSETHALPGKRTPRRASEIEQGAS